MARQHDDRDICNPIAPTKTRFTILVAEDLPANQQLLMTILRRSGHTVDLAQDGHEAVSLARGRHFDLVLMDIQMPRMNGLDAAAAIRRLPGRTRVPIIAVTACTFPGDRERCLAAGMDEYVSKPIDRARLLTLIETIARPSALCRKGVAMKSSDPLPAPRLGATSSVFDVSGALQRLGGDRALLAELVDMFLEDSPRMLQRMVAGFEAQQAKEVQHAAHSLRGLASNFGAEELIHTLRQVEDAAALGRLDGSLPLIEKARREKSELDLAIEPYR